VRDASSITPAELQAWARTGKAFLILDVRDPDELELAALPSARNVPMREIAARLQEIPREKPVVVVCHYGTRSERVARFLAVNGFPDVYNLEGGIDAYAEEVDPSIVRY
jgi:rhodanese-related sulfurtransferase